jgi:hypothetical protein
VPLARYITMMKPPPSPMLWELTTKKWSLDIYRRWSVDITVFIEVKWHPTTYGNISLRRHFTTKKFCLHKVSKFYE